MANKREIILRHYHYDPLDRLSGFASSGQPGVQCFYRNDRLATEIHGRKQYSFFEYESQVLAQQQREAGTFECALQATDFQGSVLHLVVGGQNQHTAYSAYGYRSPKSGVISFLGFNGQRRDSVTGNYMLGNGHRTYSPALMQFYTQDRLSPFGMGGKNAYAYCGRDPVNQVDPAGQFAVLARGVALLTSSPISMLQQIGKAGSGVKKSLVGRFSKITGPNRLGMGKPSKIKTTSPLNALIDQSADQVKLQKIGDEYRAARDAARPPPIARFAKSKGYSEQDLFAQDGYRNFPDVQEQYRQSQLPEVQEFLRQADVNLLTATGVHIKRYPSSRLATEKLVADIRSA